MEVLLSFLLEEKSKEIHLISFFPHHFFLTNKRWTFLFRTEDLLQNKNIFHWWFVCRYVLFFLLSKAMWVSYSWIGLTILFTREQYEIGNQIIPSSSGFRSSNMEHINYCIVFYRLNLVLLDISSVRYYFLHFSSRCWSCWFSKFKIYFILMVVIE